MNVQDVLTYLKVDAEIWHIGTVYWRLQMDLKEYTRRRDGRGTDGWYLDKVSVNLDETYVYVKNSNDLYAEKDFSEPTEYFISQDFLVLETLKRNLRWASELGQLELERLANLKKAKESAERSRQHRLALFRNLSREFSTEDMKEEFRNLRDGQKDGEE
jgi:hypothetical protein